MKVEVVKVGELPVFDKKVGTYAWVLNDDKEIRGGQFEDARVVVPLHDAADVTMGEVCRLLDSEIMMWKKVVICLRRLEKGHQVGVVLFEEPE